MTQAERVAYVRGAYDTIAAFTCDRRTLTLGSGHDAAPVAERLQELLVARGLADVEPYLKTDEVTIP